MKVFEGISPNQWYYKYIHVVGLSYILSMYTLHNMFVENNYDQKSTMALFADGFGGVDLLDECERK